MAALAILLYHAQLYFTHYAYTPQPTGLLDNLQRLGAANAQLTSSLPLQILATPLWFGFQWVDVFVLISGFALVLSLKGKPLRLAQFYRQRFLRVLLPFWTVSWLSYPLLWLLGTATDSYRPTLWSMFAGASFPLLYQYDAQLLLLPLGLIACCWAGLQWLEQAEGLRQSTIRLGAHSYSFFLVHNFVVDRTVNLMVGSNQSLFGQMLPIMVIEALIFSILADYTTPLIQRLVGAGWCYLDRRLVASRTSL